MKQMLTFVDEKKRSFNLVIPALLTTHIQQANFQKNISYILYVRVYINIPHHTPSEFRTLTQNSDCPKEPFSPPKYLSFFIRTTKPEAPYNLGHSSALL